MSTTTELKQAFDKWMHDRLFSTPPKSVTPFDAYCAGRTAAHGEPNKADFHEDGLGLAVFIVLRPGKIPRIGRPSKDIVASLREWFASNPDADIYVIRSWSDEVGCQSIENGRELLQMEGDDVPSQAGSAEQVSEREENLYVINRLATILADVAIALKGPELPLHRHGYHGLAEKAQVLVLERDLLRHQVEELRAAIQHTAPAPSKAGEWNAAIEVATKIVSGKRWQDEYHAGEIADAIEDAIRALSAPAQAQSEEAK